MICVLTVSGATSTSPSNMAVDFDATSVSSALHPGDSGILNLVVKNSGGYRAEDVRILITNPNILDGEKRFSVGTIDAGSSKTFTVPLKVKANAKAGVNSLVVTIDYDGYDSSGVRQNDMQSRWEIPATIHGSPNFEVSLSKTTYFKDTLDTLSLTGMTRGSVKDLTATLSSTCMTFIGSSRKYVGALNTNQEFNISYEIKPTATGACQTNLTLSYKDDSGSSSSDSLTLGVNIEGAGVDFKIVNVSYGETGPGETVSIFVELKNVGKAAADDSTLSLSLSSPFVPVDTSERYIGLVGAGESVQTSFDVAVGWDAQIQPYSIPLQVSYKVGGTSYNVTKDIGVDVTGKVILEVINVDTSRGLQIDIANIGTRTAEGVKAILTPANGGNFTQRNMTQSQQSGTPTGARPQQAANPMRIIGGAGGAARAGGQASSTSGTGAAATAVGGQLIEYKSNIKPTAQTTFTFDSAPAGDAILTLEYTGPNNERVTQTERLSLGSAARTSAAASLARTTSSSTTNYYYYVGGAVVLLAGWVVLRRRAGKPLRPAVFSKKN
ncbi:MAG: hypothetical protein ABH834_00235 [Candidatus Altiarchaeota archaeon]